MSRSARAFWVTRTGLGEVRDEVLPEPGAGNVLVEAICSAISRGTESLVFRGRVPPSEYERMRCPHQAGDFPAPVKYGYSSVGRVVVGPDTLRDRLVFCLHPHQSAYVVPADAVVPLPDEVPAGRAVLAANLETALNAVWDARPLIGDRISVVGCGVVGSLSAYLAARFPAVDVEIVDVNEQRARVAAAFGARFRMPGAADRRRDLVIHASGTEAGLRTALELAAPEASVVELSWYGDAEVAVSLGAAFHSQRLTLRSSQVGTVSPHARARIAPRDRLKLALSLCADPKLDVLFTSESMLEALPELMPVLSEPSSDVLCHRVIYAAE